MSARELDFRKYEGLGNDFVLVEAERDDSISAELARSLCDRRFGVGGDGVLLVVPPREGGDARMIVVNADGSIPEMCGNGLRCAALHVARKRGMTKGELSFETGAGTKLCTIDDAGGLGLVTVDMGQVRFVEDVVVDVDGSSWELALADAGNPHAITTRASTREEIASVGPRIEKHPRFPAGTNVEFAVVRAKDAIDLVVWERGVGITHACGTGACATVAVAVAKGWTSAGIEVAVHLPGGALFVTCLEGGRTIMRGPARHVFSGRAPIARTGGG